MLVCIKRFWMVTIQIAAFPVSPANKMSVYKIVNGIAIHKSATLSPSWYKRNSLAEQLNVSVSFGSHRLISDDGNASSIDDGEDVFIWLFLYRFPNSKTQSTPYRSNNSRRLKTQINQKTLNQFLPLNLIRYWNRDSLIWSFLSKRSNCW